MEILRWAIIAAAFVVSLKFITRNVRDCIIRQVLVCALTCKRAHTQTHAHTQLEAT